MGLAASQMKADGKPAYTPAIQKNKKMTWSVSNNHVVVANIRSYVTITSELAVSNHWPKACALVLSD